MWNNPQNLLAILDSPQDLLIIGLVVLVFFGGRKIPELMRGLGQGVREFKQGMSGETSSTTPPASTSAPAAPAAPTATEEKK